MLQRGIFIKDSCCLFGFFIENTASQEYELIRCSVLHECLTTLPARVDSFPGPIFHSVSYHGNSWRNFLCTHAPKKHCDNLLFVQGQRSVLSCQSFFRAIHKSKLKIAFSEMSFFQEQSLSEIVRLSEIFLCLLFCHSRRRRCNVDKMAKIILFKKRCLLKRKHSIE